MTRTQKENAIAGKLPPDNKRGRGRNRTIFLTGTIAEVLGQPSYTSVRLSELSNEDIDKLYETLTKKKASPTLRDELIKLGAKDESLRDNLRPILAELTRVKTADYASSAKWHRSNAKKLVVGKFMRLTWSRGAVMLEELPVKGKRQLRYFSLNFSWLSNSARINAFLWQNIEMWAKVTKGDSYDVALRKLKAALDTATADAISNDPEQGDVYSRHLNPTEDTVYYLHVAPGSSEPISVAGKDFNLKVDWNSFRTLSPDSDMQNHDPHYTMIASTSSASARKLYKLLNANPDALRNVTFDGLSDFLNKHKVKWTYQFSQWR